MAPPTEKPAATPNAAQQHPGRAARARTGPGAAREARDSQPVEDTVEDAEDTEEEVQRTYRVVSERPAEPLGARLGREHRAGALPRTSEVSYTDARRLSGEVT